MLYARDFLILISLSLLDFVEPARQLNEAAPVVGWLLERAPFGQEQFAVLLLEVLCIRQQPTVNLILHVQIEVLNTFSFFPEAVVDPVLSWLSINAQAMLPAFGPVPSVAPSIFPCEGAVAMFQI